MCRVITLTFIKSRARDILVTPAAAIHPWPASFILHFRVEQEFVSVHFDKRQIGLCAELPIGEASASTVDNTVTFKAPTWRVESRYRVLRRRCSRVGEGRCALQSEAKGLL